MRRCPRCLTEKPDSQFGWKNKANGRKEPRCRECRSEVAHAAYAKAKVDALAHYCGGVPKCGCCGERRIEFLTFDHINGGGRKHRQRENGAVMIALWLKRRGYPEGYRVLCMNCNMSIGIYGYCPHQRPDVAEKV